MSLKPFVRDEERQLSGGGKYRCSGPYLEDLTPIYFDSHGFRRNSIYSCDLLVWFGAIHSPPQEQCMPVFVERCQLFVPLGLGLEGSSWEFIPGITSGKLINGK